MNDYRHTVYWPLTYTEQAAGWLDGTATITIEQIADYSYPPGNPRRYTYEGWQLWKRIAAREGIPISAEWL